MFKKCLKKKRFYVILVFFEKLKFWWKIWKKWKKYQNELFWYFSKIHYFCQKKINCSKTLLIWFKSLLSPQYKFWALFVIKLFLYKKFSQKNLFCQHSFDIWKKVQMSTIYRVFDPTLGGVSFFIASKNFRNHNNFEVQKSQKIFFWDFGMFGSTQPQG